MKKTYVLDTSALLEDPDIFFRKQAEFIIPLAVIGELDGHKRSEYEWKAKAARRVTRHLDNLGSYKDLTTGAKVSTGGTIRLVADYVPLNDLGSKADNRVLGTGLKLAGQSSDVTVLTTDGNMRIVARARGLKGEFPYFLGAPKAMVPEPRKRTSSPNKYWISFAVAVVICLLLAAVLTH